MLTLVTSDGGRAPLFYLRYSTVAQLLPSHHNIMILKMNQNFESELLSKALLEPPSDNLPPDDHDLPPELLQLIFSNLPPQSLKYDSPLI